MKTLLCVIEVLGLVMSGCATYPEPQPETQGFRTTSRTCDMSLSVTGNPTGNAFTLGQAIIATPSYFSMREETTLGTSMLRAHRASRSPCLN